MLDQSNKLPRLIMFASSRPWSHFTSDTPARVLDRNLENARGYAAETPIPPTLAKAENHDSGLSSNQFSDPISLQIFPWTRLFPIPLFFWWIKVLLDLLPNMSIEMAPLNMTQSAAAEESVLLKPSSSNRRKSILLDTWLFESFALAFSIACFYCYPRTSNCV